MHCAKEGKLDLLLIDKVLYVVNVVKQKTGANFRREKKTR